MKLGKIPTSRKRREKWGAHTQRTQIHITDNAQLYLNDLTAEASSSFTSNTV
jgi:hypothetical protein